MCFNTYIAVSKNPYDWVMQGRVNSMFSLGTTVAEVASCRLSPIHMTFHLPPFRHSLIMAKERS